MPNPCIGCKKDCCENFSISYEPYHPLRVQKELTSFPFIHKTGNRLVLFSGHETVVGIYNCDRHNPDTKLCEGYGINPRPAFCENTGTKITPHNQCLLKP